MELNMDRRRFLGTLGGAALASTCQTSAFGAQAASVAGSISVGIPALVNGSVAVTGSATLPAPQESGIEHIVVVTMENRSFDHFLGWLPGADGKQAGLSYTDKTGAARGTHWLAPDFEGCGHADPNHSYAASRTAYDGGRMDGFLRAGNNDAFSIGYYVEQDLPFFSALAQNYTVCDRYFASILGPTFPNRMFLWAAQTDRLDDGVSLSRLPTIFDRLSAAGISHRYYFNNLPYLAFWGFKYFTSTGLFADFMTHAAAGTLPAVSFVDPVYTILDDGTGNDDHPHADIRNGDAFLAKIFHALSSSPAWRNTVLIINFDEWGGFYEHVPPPRAVAPNKVDTDQVNGQALLGLRVPALFVSPFTQNGGVSHTVFDHTSILKLIEWRWGLSPLTARDASPLIGNPATAMNFTTPSHSVPSLPTPHPVFSIPCFGGGIFSPYAEPADPATSTALGARGRSNVSEWGQLAQTDTVRQWLQHPDFQRLSQ